MQPGGVTASGDCRDLGDRRGRNSLRSITLITEETPEGCFLVSVLVLNRDGSERGRILSRAKCDTSWTKIQMVQVHQVCEEYPLLSHRHGRRQVLLELRGWNGSKQRSGE